MLRSNPQLLYAGPPRNLYDLPAVQQIITSQEALLDEIFNFKQSASCNGQEEDTCKRLVKLFRSVLDCIPTDVRDLAPCLCTAVDGLPVVLGCSIRLCACARVWISVLLTATAIADPTHRHI